MTKDLKDKAIKFKGQDYVQVKDRILYLAEEVKNYSVDTNYEYFPEQGMWVVKATLKIGDNTFTGLAQEIEGSSFINKTSALENAETSAVGRACAMAGIGVLDSIASMDEITKAGNRSINRPEPVENAAGVKTTECTGTSKSPGCGKKATFGKVWNTDKGDTVHVYKCTSCDASTYIKQ